MKKKIDGILRRRMLPLALMATGITGMAACADQPSGQNGETSGGEDASLAAPRSPFAALPTPTTPKGPPPLGLRPSSQASKDGGARTAGELSATSSAVTGTPQPQMNCPTPWVGTAGHCYAYAYYAEGAPNLYAGAAATIQIQAPVVTGPNQHSIAEFAVIFNANVDHRDDVEMGYIVNSGDNRPQLFVYDWKDGPGNYNASPEWHPLANPAGYYAGMDLSPFIGRSVPMRWAYQPAGGGLGARWVAYFNNQAFGYYLASNWPQQYATATDVSWYGEVSEDLPLTTSQMGNGLSASNPSAATMTGLCKIPVGQPGTCTPVRIQFPLTSALPYYDAAPIDANTFDGFRYGGPGLDNAITSLLLWDGAAWQNASSTTVNAGASVWLSVPTIGAGSWKWTGPNGFSATTQVVNVTPTQPGLNMYTVVYTDASGHQSPATFVITTPYCHVDYAVVDNWGARFKTAISIKNLSASAIQGWKLDWTFPGAQVVTNPWGATYVQSGPAVTATNLSWDATIPAGGTLSGTQVGFNANGPSAVPSAFNLNGIRCN